MLVFFNLYFISYIKTLVTDIGFICFVSAEFGNNHALLATELPRHVGLLCTPGPEQASTEVCGRGRSWHLLGTVSLRLSWSTASGGHGLDLKVLQRPRCKAWSPALVRWGGGV